MSDLNGKVILLTGALGRLGQASLALFLAKGATVIAIDRLDVHDFPEMLSLLERYGDRGAIFVQADVSDESEVITLMAQVRHNFRRLDGILHTVHANVWKSALELSLEEWEKTIRGSLTSTFLVCKYALPMLIESGGGSIVNTSSILGMRPQKGCLAYGAAKAGVNQLTKVMAIDYADQGIRANVLVPGDFRSEEELAAQPERVKTNMSKLTLAGRSGSATEIAEVAAFLLSDAASYVTASLYMADGGYRL